MFRQFIRPHHPLGTLRNFRPESRLLLRRAGMKWFRLRRRRYARLLPFLPLFPQVIFTWPGAHRERSALHRARKGPPMYEVRKIFTLFCPLPSYQTANIVPLTVLWFKGRTSLVGVPPVTGLTKCHAREFSWWHDENLEQT